MAILGSCIYWIMSQEVEDQFAYRNKDVKQCVVSHLLENHVSHLLADFDYLRIVLVDLAHSVHIELVGDKGLKVTKFTLSPGSP